MTLDKPEIERTGDEKIANALNALDVMDEVRKTLECLQAQFAFFEELDTNSPQVIRWGFRRKINKAKKQCLSMMFNCMAILDEAVDKEPENDPTEDDDDD